MSEVDNEQNDDDNNNPGATATASDGERAVGYGGDRAPFGIGYA